MSKNQSALKSSSRSSSIRARFVAAGVLLLIAIGLGAIGSTAPSHSSSYQETSPNQTLVHNDEVPVDCFVPLPRIEVDLDSPLNSDDVDFPELKP